MITGTPVTSGAPTDLPRIDVLGPEGSYRTRNRDILRDTAGVAVAEMSIAPRLFVTRSVRALHRTRPLPLEQRRAAMAAAADAFHYGSIAGLDFEAYVELTCRLAGLPKTVARSGCSSVAEALRTAIDGVAPARPTGAVIDWRDAPRRGGAVWARRGEVLAVHAPGNAPGVHGLWPQALLLGYRVAVRPSRREPLTAHRVVEALRIGGFRPQDAVFLPTDYPGADELVRAADLALVYGGQDVVDRYAGAPAVFANGPGRSKVLLTAEQPWSEAVDTVVDSVAGLGGMACVNASAVLCEGDPAPFTRAVAERLAAIPALPHTDECAALPTAPVDTAHILARYLARRAAGTVALLGADQVVADLGDGRAVLRPVVHLLTCPDVSILNIELPFPCVWIAPWSRDDGIAPLRNSLVLTAITDDDDLVDELVAEPSIGTVYRGRIATHHSAAEIPHEGYLADFLMRSKGFAHEIPR